MTTTGKNRIMIFGPKSDGTYVVEFRTAAGEALAISIPRTEAGVIRHFQERLPYGRVFSPMELPHPSNAAPVRVPENPARPPFWTATLGRGSRFGECLSSAPLSPCGKVRE